MDPIEDEAEREVDPEIQWGQALEPLKPGEFISGGWQYNLLDPGPLPDEIADVFGGGQYSQKIVGGGRLVL